MEDAVLPMAGRYGFRSIFLATDDEVVLNDTRAWPQFQWLYLPDLNRGDLKTALWEENLVKKRLDNYFEAKEVLLDVLLLAEGDALPGRAGAGAERRRRPRAGERDVVDVVVPTTASYSRWPCISGGSRSRSSGRSRRAPASAEKL